MDSPVCIPSVLIGAALVVVVMIMTSMAVDYGEGIGAQKCNENINSPDKK